MSVYVDDLAYRRAPWQGGRSCHMVADTIQELDEMAAKVGLKKTWKQSARGGRGPHYDMGPKFRARAVALGAIQLTFHELGDWLRKQRGKESGCS